MNAAFTLTKADRLLQVKAHFCTTGCNRELKRGFTGAQLLFNSLCTAKARLETAKNCQLHKLRKDVSPTVQLDSPVDDP